MEDNFEWEDENEIEVFCSSCGRYFFIPFFIYEAELQFCDCGEKPEFLCEDCEEDNLP